MAIKPKCDKCGKELEVAGGIALSPPCSTGNTVIKYHICIECWNSFINWIQKKNNSVEIPLEKHSNNYSDNIEILTHKYGGGGTCSSCHEYSGNLAYHKACECKKRS